MNKIVFDIETQNTFSEVGSNDPKDLDIAVVCIYNYATDEYLHFLQENFNSMWPYFEKADIVIGYNSEHFDMPLLSKYYHGDLSKIHHVDLMKEIRNVLGRRVKLDDVASATLKIRKSGHGLDAIDWWKKGEIDKIIKYCKDDVKITKDVYEYALANGAIKYKDNNKSVELKLDISNWEPKEKATMTFSLPF